MHSFPGIFYLFTHSLASSCCALIHWHLLVVHSFTGIFLLFTHSLASSCCAMCTYSLASSCCSLIHWHLLVVHLFTGIFRLFIHSLASSWCALCTHSRKFFFVIRVTHSLASPCCALIRSHLFIRSHLLAGVGAGPALEWDKMLAQNYVHFYSQYTLYRTHVLAFIALYV